MSSDTRRTTRPLLSDEVELLFVKSKVYLHPTSSKKDNIAGFLALSRGPNSTNKDILLAFTPETQLSSTEIKKYQEVDEAVESSNKKSVIVKKPIGSTLSGYSFVNPLSFIYSIQVRKPSSGFWFGSVIINTKDGNKLPIVFFHDNESPSTIKNQKIMNQKMDPFGEDGEVYWGGQDFLKALKGFINVERSTVEPSVYLVNPESSDLINFAPFKTPADKPKKNEQAFKLPDVNKFLASAKWKILETVATFSAKTKNQVLDMVDEHAPLPIKHIINQPEVQRIGEDFDSARVYLAKWAQQVKEEAEASQKTFLLNDDIYSKINRELGSDELLTNEEISKTSRRNEISKQEWDSFFDYSGRLSVTVQEIKSRIFHGGLEDSIRPTAWLFLLEVYPWESSHEEREVLAKSYESAYQELKLKWVNDEEKRQTEYWQDQKHRIEKDIRRTDRQLPIFQDPKTGDSAESEPEDDQFDVSNITNPHLYKMREILLTYNEYNVNLGYVQGMTDLLSPLYVQFEDESLTFWAFTKFMERMERNFLRDQSGMMKQMTTLNKLLQFMLPQLYKHLEKCESNDLFFYFRMLLVWFKRELEWPQVLRLWEIFWTDYYTSQHHLFFALAILSDHERIIIQNLTRFDEVLKYMNDLSMKLKLDPLLIRSELLFLKFKRMVDIIDRENGLKSTHKGQTDDTIEIGPDLRELLSKKLVIQKEHERQEGMGGG